MLLAGLGAVVLVLDTATRVPVALAALLRACRPVLDAMRELRAKPTEPASAPRVQTERGDDQ